MNRLIASIKKEILILVRDWAGLGLIFLMPLVLVLVMTLIQDASFRKLDETKISLLYLDEDRDTLGIKVLEGLESNGYFNVVTKLEGRELSERAILEQVSEGNFQIGIVITKGSTEAILKRGRLMVQQTMNGADSSFVADTTAKARILIYFDPAMKNSFKLTVRNALENFTSKIEAGIMFHALSSELAKYLPDSPAPIDQPVSSISYEEIYATDKYTDIIPNSIQHNVPAWTIFAMFFIVIPLTGNLVQEKQSGLATRLIVMPGNQFQALSAKVAVFMLVGLVQFLLILALGKFVLPQFGMPQLVLGPEKPALFLVAMATALAATGYSVLVGTVARTHDQAAIFGMVSVIILAAIGGIWVPVFMMTNLMQAISIISPLNWSLDAFYDILLRGQGLKGVAGNIAALGGFFLVNLMLAVWVARNKRR